MPFRCDRQAKGTGRGDINRRGAGEDQEDGGMPAPGVKKGAPTHQGSLQDTAAQRIARFLIEERLQRHHECLKLAHGDGVLYL